jgi:hypothetical protein
LAQRRPLAANFAVANHPVAGPGIIEPCAPFAEVEDIQTSLFLGFYSRLSYSTTPIPAAWCLRHIQSIEKTDREFD